LMMAVELRLAWCLSWGCAFHHCRCAPLPPAAIILITMGPAMISQRLLLPVLSPAACLGMAAACGGGDVRACTRCLLGLVTDEAGVFGGWCRDAY
jgi:hypothetical protein